MAFWRTYYHLVWATHERHPFIIARIEPVLYDYIARKSHALGSIVHAVGGIEDHIHLVVSIPPRLAIAEFIGQVKGSSAHHLNRQNPPLSATFGWQGGYGVFSLGKKQLEPVIDYVRNQKIHHQQETTIPAMERVADSDDGCAAG
jgi:REP element-mobilizing transposase RayT